MNILDIILIIPIVWFGYRGYTRGFILSITSLIALIAGIYFSIHFSSVVAAWLLTEFGLNSQYLNIIAFIITFAAVVVVIQIVGRFLDQIADWAALGMLNRIAGLALGLGKSVITLGVLIFVINSFDVNQKLITHKMRSESLLYQPLSGVVPKIWPTVKQWLPDNLDPEKEIKDAVII